VEVEKNKSDEVMVEGVKKKRARSSRVAKGKEVVSATPIQNLPYPHAPSKRENEQHYARFMDIFKQLKVNIPFAEALEQMPKYAKFMKDILTKKRRYTEPETIVLDASCSAIIQRTLPKKEVDAGRVTLPVKIGDVYVGKGLIDLGSSINLIPLSIVKRLGNIEMKAIRMTLQLADKSTTHPHGLAQDVLVKVDKFFFPVDFIVIDMEEDDDAPLILGRPFMKTARMMIDVDDGLMKVRVQNEEVTFDLFEAMKHSKDSRDSFRIDVIEEATFEVSKHIHEFVPGQLVLLFNSRLRLFPGKLKSKWSGPFRVKEVKEYGAVVIENLEKKDSWTVNGQHLKIYLGGLVDRESCAICLDAPL
jgi:hypothetical protein